MGLSPRLRPSPFFEATLRYGATRFTIYNHMLLPTAFAGAEAEYEALTNDVAIWDVAGERQVEIVGPDAERLTQYLCTRDVSTMTRGQARYTFVCDQRGGILNDPVLLKIADDRFWLSLADSDILLWAKAVAAEGGYDVAVTEPDVSPVQVQGPKSIHVIRAVCGDVAADQKYYRCTETVVDGVPLVVSRTGWSGEFGYEIFLRDGSKGDWLWERLFAAGADHGVVPGAPNQIRRIEGGILSYGTDMDASVNPFELGFGRMVALGSADDFIGKEALAAVAEAGVSRLTKGLRLAGEPLPGNGRLVPVTRSGATAGRMSSMVWSPRFGRNLGIALLDVAHATDGVRVDVHTDQEVREAEVCSLPFVEPIKA